MSPRSRILTRGARAVTGLVVVAAVGGSVLALGSATLPEVSREPLGVTVDTTQDAQQTLVCAGSFAELGVNTDDPSSAVPTGSPDVTVSGEAGETLNLQRAAGGDGLPTVLRGPDDAPLGAAQLQSVSTETLRGATASACSDPLNEQWLVGGGSGLGVSTTISLGNPGEVAATVSITVYDENGQVDALETAGVLVAPGTQQIVSLNGYAPDRERFAVRVESTGAPIAASLGVGEVTGLDPFAVSSVTRQVQPEEQLVVPGVANVSEGKQGPNDAGEGDAYPVVVRALAPGGEEGTAHVWALDKNGRKTDLGEIPLAASAVGELRVTTWPQGASTAIIEADVPIVGGVLGSASEDDAHDSEWFAPAPQISADSPTAVPVIGGGRLVLANLGDSDASVTITGSNGKSRKTTIEAGVSVTTKADASTTIESSEPLYGGVRYVSGANIAGYPVLAQDPRDGELTVYTR